MARQTGIYSQLSIALLSNYRYKQCELRAPLTDWWSLVMSKAVATWPIVTKNSRFHNTHCANLTHGVMARLS